MTYQAPIKKADHTATAPAPRQLNVIEAALVALSGVCDGAHSQDNSGFNGTDSRYGKSLAAQIEAGRSLTYKQAQGAIKILPKYKKQLVSMGLTVPTKEDFFALYKNPKRVEVIGDEIAIFSYSGGTKALCDIGLSGSFYQSKESRFDLSDDSIRFPKTVENAETIWELLPADYELSDEFRLLVMDCGF